MDKWLTIVITAVVSATITTLVKSLLEASAKVERITRIKETAKKTFTKKVRSFLWNCLWGIFCIWVLLRDVSKPTPPSRGDVLKIAWDLFVVMFWVTVLMVEIIWSFATRKGARDFQKLAQQAVDIPPAP